MRIAKVWGKVHDVHYFVSSRCHLLKADIDEARAIVDQVPKLKPDVVVLDISMGDRNHTKIEIGSLPSEIVFLTVHEELDFIRATFDAAHPAMFSNPE